MTPVRRLAIVLLAGLVPWVVVVTDSGVSLVLSMGLLSLDPVHVTPIWDYVLVLTRGLPPSLGSWPVATVLWVLAVDSATIGWRFGREDRRVTGGLLVIAGLSLVPVVLAVGRPAGVSAYALGTTALWLVAWLGYRDDLKRAVVGARPRGER